MTFEEMVEKAEAGEEYDCCGDSNIWSIWYEANDENYKVTYSPEGPESVQIVGQMEVVYNPEVQ